jgi:glycosyltransferase involved in cell wall biosynthesis
VERGTGAPLRIALLSPCFWPEVRRGGERFTHELALGLRARGQLPRLITSHPGPPRRSVEDGFPILRLPRPPQPRWLLQRFEPYLTHVPLSLAALHAREYDLAHAVYPTDALAAAAWGRRTGRPTLLSYLGIPEPSWLAQRRRGQVLGTLVRRLDAVTALSGYAADAFRRSLGYEARVIPPGVDLEEFVPAPARAPEPTILCSAAADEPRKHVALLIAAFDLVRRERPETRLVLSRPRDATAAARAGVPARAAGMRWADLDDRTTLGAALGRAWVAVLPAPDEAFGLVLAEALACGTPVVGYDGGGIPEVVDRQDIGRRFDRLEPRALASALLEALALAAAPETVDRCRERASEFSVDRFTERYLALYRELGAP